VPPLGVVEELEAHSVRWRVTDGSVLVLYTDGLIERRGESLTEGLERLRRSVSSDEPERLCGRVMEALIGSYVPADDIALLALRIRPTLPKSNTGALWAKRSGVSVMRSELFACDPSSVGLARRFISECVEQLGLRSLPDAQLMTSELATNAIVHAHSRFDLTVEKLPDGGARIEVRDFGSGTPHVLDCDPVGSSGRGLKIVTLLSESWGMHERPGGLGKSIWFTVAG
jgi:anti-sigma regulatory factor (Ser/Thr protein kinase)